MTKLKDILDHEEITCLNVLGNMVHPAINYTFLKSVLFGALFVFKTYPCNQRHIQYKQINLENSPKKIIPSSAKLMHVADFCFNINSGLIPPKFIITSIS